MGQDQNYNLGGTPDVFFICIFKAIRMLLVFQDKNIYLKTRVLEFCMWTVKNVMGGVGCGGGVSNVF